MNDHSWKFTMEDNRIGRTGYEKSLHTIIVCSTSESVCLTADVISWFLGLRVLVVFFGMSTGSLRRRFSRNF